MSVGFLTLVVGRGLRSPNSNNDNNANNVNNDGDINNNNVNNTNNGVRADCKVGFNRYTY
jgi:hypothetical protein